MSTMNEEQRERLADKTAAAVVQMYQETAQVRLEAQLEYTLKKYG